MRFAASVALAAAALAFAVPAALAAPAVASPVKNIVLVHGAWADGSGWQGVYDILTKDGYNVSVVANPLTSLADDVAAVDRVLARQDGPTILVGHSYGGTVITEAGDDPKVVGLVYIAAFAPDAGENTFGLLKDSPQPPIEPSADGFAFFNKQAFVAAFAPDAGTAAPFMADAQVPVSIEKAGSAPVTAAAWKTKPSWYLIATDDQIIPPAVQKKMAKRAKAKISESPGSHVVYVSKPEAAAAVIVKAANGVKAK